MRSQLKILKTQKVDKHNTNPPMSTGKRVSETWFKMTWVKSTNVVKLSGSLQLQTTRHLSYHNDMQTLTYSTLHNPVICWCTSISNDADSESMFTAPVEIIWWQNHCQQPICSQNLLWGETMFKLAILFHGTCSSSACLQQNTTLAMVQP